VSNFEDKLILDSLPLKIVKTSSGENVKKTNCPSCNEKKSRLYFLWNNRTQVTNVYCHNCGYSRILKNFVKEFFKEVYEENYKYVINSRSICLEDLNRCLEKDLIQPGFNVNRELPKNSICLENLPKNHKALNYVKERLIPKKHYKDLFYCDNFKILAENYRYKIIKWKDEDRLIIPFWSKENKITCIQGRSFEENTKLRYITLKIKKDHLKIWGINAVDSSKNVFVTEGPLDAMFLDNAVSMAGSDVSNEDLEKELKVNRRDIIFLYDNEPTSEEIKNKMYNKIEFGFSIVIWDVGFPFKDVNDAVLGGFPLDKIGNMVYHGLEATLKFMSWRA